MPRADGTPGRNDSSAVATCQCSGKPTKVTVICEVTAVAVLVTAVASARTTAVPRNTSAPTISGTAREGDTLTANNGGWANSPTAFTYQWQRCSSSGSGCANITGAVAKTYRLTAADVGRTVRVLVTAVNAEGQSTVHWRHTFWIFGLLGLVWCGFFWWWFRDRPEQKTTVNAAELQLIRQGEAHTETAHANVPWRRLLTSYNLWVLCAMYSCSAYGWYFNITYLPGYLTSRFGVSKDSAGGLVFSFMAGAPLLFGSLACLVGGVLTDQFIRRTGERLADVFDWPGLLGGPWPFGSSASITPAVATRTSRSGSCSSLVSAGSAGRAAGPIAPSVRTADQRTKRSVSFSAFVTAGAAAEASGP